MKRKLSVLWLAAALVLLLALTWFASAAEPRLSNIGQDPSIPVVEAGSVGAELQRAPERPAEPYQPNPRGGYVPAPIDLSHYQAEWDSADVAASLSRFDWRQTGKVTPVKNQNPCGACYAFASLGNFESKLLIDGAGTWDFSENNAKECDFYARSCSGSNYFAMASYFSQKGTVLESCDPYVPADVPCTTGCPYQKTLLDWRIISGNSIPDTNVLKNYIMTYGPVYTTLYAGWGDAWDTEFGNYDGSYTLYHPGSEIPNHAVLIVGWDDSLSHQGGYGGWIVKNSWGTGWGGTCGYGTEGGYFTIAYGSASIGKSSSFIYDWQNYDGNSLYYDEGGWDHEWGTGSTTLWGLAKYYPPSNTNVTRVEFWTDDVTTDVDVYLYDTFSGGTLSNLLAQKLNNSFAEPGYHSVALDSPVPVSAGNDVIAVVKFTNASYTYPVVADSEGPTETGRTYISQNGTAWTDLGTTQGEDVGIRIRTSASQSTATPTPTRTGTPTRTATATRTPTATPTLEGAGRMFLKCDADVPSTVFTTDESCVRLRIYRSSYPNLNSVTWYDHQGNPSFACPNTPGGCTVITYNYSGGVLSSWDFYYYIAGQDRVPGTYSAKALNQSSAVLFTDPFQIIASDSTPTATPTQTRPSGGSRVVYLPMVFRQWPAGPRPTATPTATPTRTPTATRTPTPTATEQSACTTILNETFEGTFPGAWQLSDQEPGYGEYYWGKRNCMAFEGTYSGWAVGGGANGSGLSCGSDYPDNVSSWMAYGPFSLADAASAELTFKAWLDSEEGYDYLFWGASTDGTHYYGLAGDGDTHGWADAALDLSDVYQLGSLLGEPNVWIALVFSSDGSINYPDGVHVDNIVLQKCTTAQGAGSGGSTAPASNLSTRPAAITLPR